MGRNDNYGRDFKRRFVQSMNFLAWSAQRAGVLNQLEVVFTDWNSASPLANAIQLSQEAAQMVRFIVVPPAIAAPLNYGKTPFHTGMSLNVAFRRARGKFIGMMPGDILLTQYPLRSLMAILRQEWELPFNPEMALLGVPRKFMAAHVDDAKYFDTPENIERLLSSSDWYLTADTNCRSLNGGYGMWVLPAEWLHQANGTMESIGGWGYSDTDLAMRLADRLKIVNLAGFGVYCYDYDISIKEYRAKSKNIRFKLKHFSLENADNPSDWGMAGVELPESRARIGEFSPLLQAAHSQLPMRDLLLWNARAVQVNSCRRFSRLALATVDMAMQNRSRRIAFLGISDISPPTALSLVDPMAEILIIDHAADNVARFEAIDRAMSETRHQGSLHYAPDLPAKALLEDLDLLVVQTLEKAEQLAGYLAANGIAMAAFPLPLTDKQQQMAKGIYIYSNSDLKLAEAKHNWKEFSGNILLRHSISRQFVRLWNIFARVPLWQWPKTIKTFWQWLH